MKNTYFTTLALDFYRSVFILYPETNFIILDSLNYFFSKEGIEIYGFVIMPNHIHILWDGGKKVRRFKSFTAKRILQYLNKLDPEFASQMRSIRTDRRNKVWKSTHGNLKILSRNIFHQKLRYIHTNPIKPPFSLVKNETEFLFSSAFSYWTGRRNFPFLTIAAKNYQLY